MTQQATLFAEAISAGSRQARLAALSFGEEAFDCSGSRCDGIDLD